MALDTAIERFRRREAENMRSECTVTRETGEPELDLSTGELERDYETVYSGKCSVRPATWVGADTQAGEQEVRLRSALGKLPHNTSVAKDDLLTVTSSEHDADLVGRVYRITDAFHDDWQIVRKVILEEVT